MSHNANSGVTCPVCFFTFAKLKNHLRFSPQCAPVESPDAGAYVGSTPVLPCPRPPLQDDILEIPTPDNGTSDFSSGVSCSPGRCPDSSLTDLDDDDYEMFYNTQMYQIGESGSASVTPTSTQTASTVAAPTATTAGSVILAAGTPLAVEDIVPPHPVNLCNAPLESGLEFTVGPHFGKSDHCFTKSDRSTMRLYNICDQAGSPRYLMDSLMSQMKTEITRNQFDPLHSALTLREPFMARMHRKFPSPPPQAIQVQLECFADPITIYRFHAIDQLQHHLLRNDLYGDLSRLNVNRNHPFDQSTPPPPSGMGEITDGEWYQRVISTHVLRVDPEAAPDDLEPQQAEQVQADVYRTFVLTLEEYKDSTGSDSKESFSLEPVLASTGLLDSSFNGDPTSRFILGYIPNLSNLKSSASQTRRQGTQMGYGSSVRDYHKCLSIILEAIVEAQRSPPLIDILLGTQLRRCRTVLLMGTLLGDGKSQDMSCGRVGAQTNTLRLSRAVFTPSDIADNTAQAFHWVKSSVIEAVARAALFDPELGRQALPYDNSIEYNQYLHNLQHQTERRKQVAGAKRRVRIATEILNKALGSHKVRNAYFALDFASDGGVFGHTLADVMHLVEEGILKYILAVFLEALSATARSDLDDLVTKLFRSNRCHGSRLFPRLNFTRGYSRLTLLSSEERTGAFLALIVVLVTEKGKSLLQDRFSVGFDERRKARAEAFKAKKKHHRDNDDSSVEDEMPPAATEEPDLEAQPIAQNKRTKEFVPTRLSIRYVCRQIRRHDLEFLFTEVFPELPARHIFQCLKIIWESTYRLTDDVLKITHLPRGILNIEPFRTRPVNVAIHSRVFSPERLKTEFAGYRDPILDPLVQEDQPSISNNLDDFLRCCEGLLSLRSFFNYSAEHCPDEVPRKWDGSFNLALVKQRTQEVAQALKENVNRGDGTNQWRIPKFIDMLLLPEYMDFLASTGRYHVGFCERGLKKWAKMPANTSQKRGRGVFEGQCAARIRENSMVHYALRQMDSDNESDSDVLNGDEVPCSVQGACFHIAIVAEPTHARRKVIECTRLNNLKQPHSLQFPLPPSILAFFKSRGYIGEDFEYRTEAVVGSGVPYRAHPNFQGGGAWYDFAMVRFEHNELDTTHVNDNHMYPAKILGFFRKLPQEGLVGLATTAREDRNLDFSVLVHSATYQQRNSSIHRKRTLLTRSWLYEVKQGRSPQPDYRVAGTTRSNFVLGEHIFGVEELPGLHERYETEEHRRFIVLSDMRKVWPRVFIHGPRGL